MKPKRTTKSETLAAARAILLEEAHEAEVQATMAGRESHMLRAAGREADAGGDWLLAHRLFSEAVGCFDADDLGAAASSAAYDLAISMTLAPAWHEREMLQEAERLLRRCLMSDARMREPMRASRTFDALGQVLRRQALLAGRSDVQRETLLATSVSMSKRAIDAADGAGPPGWKDGAGHRLTYANSLAATGKHREALALHEAALHLLRRLKRLIPNSDEIAHEVATAARSFQAARVRSLLALGRPSDLKRVLDIADGLASAQGGVATQIHTAAVHAQVALGQTDKARARLRAIKWDGDYRSLAMMGSAARALGDLEHAASCYRGARGLVLEARSDALADHVADMYAREMQGLAREEAALLLDLGRPVDAFLAYENASALRYHDMVSEFAWTARSPVVRALHERAVAVSHVMVGLEDLGARLAPLDDAKRGAVVAEMLAQLEEAKLGMCLDDIPSDEAEAAGHAMELFAASLEQLRRSRSSLGPIQRIAGDMRSAVAMLNEAMGELDPHVGGAAFPWMTEMSPDALQSCLVEHPTTALMRISVESSSLVVVCVWLAAGKIMGRSASLSLPSSALSCLWEAAAPGAQKNPDQAALVAVLRELDLSAAYPDAPVDRVVLLPSSLAALVPWAAAGRPGHTLLDRFESISYLPMLTPMVMRQAPRKPRHGTVVVAPGVDVKDGGTNFHDIAYSVRGEEEEHLEGAHATRSAFLDAGRHADVVSVYAHGEYQVGSGPELRLADGTLHLQPLPHGWAGCERVELWACRSGVNLSLDYLTPAVDEAFGADIGFHRVGVRSTIGTLWSVNDLVTAHIARRFRMGLATGMSPPGALASAQRWWRDEAVAEVAKALRTLDDDAAHLRITELLGAGEDAVATLGPVDGGGVDREALLAALSGPTAWAGYRFVGVADRRPVGAPDPDAERPLTPEESAHVEEVFARALGVDHPLVQAYRTRREGRPV